MIFIYGKNNCKYCKMSTALLDLRDKPYLYYNIDEEPERKEEMFKRQPNARTVPQIWVNETHIGGYKELSLLFTDEGY
jgi:glutaredoxin 3